MLEMIAKNKKWVLIGAGLLTALVAAVVLGYNVIQADNIKSLETVASEPEQAENIIAWGEVTYERIYDINIDFPSAVTEVKVKEGDHVSLGQELVTLDMTEYLGTMDKLREQLDAGQASLLNTEQDTGALHADIAQLQKDITTKTEELTKGTNSDLRILQTSLGLAKKELENAERDVQTNQTLYDAGSISKSALDQYIDILAQRVKELSDIESNIKKTKSSLKSEIDHLNVSLKSKQAQLDQIKSNNTANTAIQSSSVKISQIELEILQYKGTKEYLSGDHIISCVKNGIVQNIEVVNGTLLGTQNMPTRVLQLIDSDSIVVNAEIDEEFINYVSPGKIVSIVPASDSSLSIQGTVTHISNIAVEKDGKRIIIVEVKPQDPTGKLKPGFSADVYFPAE